MNPPRQPITAPFFSRARRANQSPPPPSRVLAMPTNQRPLGKPAVPTNQRPRLLASPLRQPISALIPARACRANQSGAEPAGNGSRRAAMRMRRGQSMCGGGRASSGRSPREKGEIPHGRIRAEQRCVPLRLQLRQGSAAAAPWPHATACPLCRVPPLRVLWHLLGSLRETQTWDGRFHFGVSLRVILQTICTNHSVGNAEGKRVLACFQND